LSPCREEGHVVVAGGGYGATFGGVGASLAMLTAAAATPAARRKA
jgi:hypothetical protein